MTRLQPFDIAKISDRLSAYDEELLAKTGHTLRSLACYAAGLNEEEIVDKLTRVHVAVVPIRWGKGMIDRFSETTRDILKHMGFQTFVTEFSDVSGLAEAYDKKADVIFLADDDQFVALNTQTRRVVYNADATGKGFAAGLALMAGELKRQSVLVIGCGPVGRSAAATLINDGVRVSIYDIVRSRAEALALELDRTHCGNIVIEADFQRAVIRHRLVIEATNAAEIIQAHDISPGTYVAAPGMPLGLSRNALRKISDRLLHDPLQIGVATMAIEVSKQIPAPDEAQIQAK